MMPCAINQMRITIATQQNAKVYADDGVLSHKKKIMSIFTELYTLNISLQVR